MNKEIEDQTELTLALDGDIVQTVLSPRMSDLTSRQCSNAELQAALVHLIQLYNEQGKKMNTPYTI